MCLEIVDSIAPVKSVCLKQRTESWFNGNILHMIIKCNKAYIKLKSEGSAESRKVYNVLRNNTQKLINKTKRKFIRNELEENKGCIKKMWKTLNLVNLWLINLILFSVMLLKI